MSDQIDVNQLSNAIQQKVGLPVNKNQSDIDFVIESQLPTASNNYTWYRLYKSGWVEQGGYTSSASATIILLKQFADTNYQVMATVLTTSPSTNYYATKVSGKTTSQFVLTGNATGSMWEAKGMSAQGGS